MIHRARSCVRPCNKKETALDRAKARIQKAVPSSRIPADFSWAVVPVSNGIELYVLSENLGFILSSDRAGELLGLDCEFNLRLRSLWSI